jgi:very-short-patch-repair endonuclease
LDFSVFPELERSLLVSIINNKPFTLEIEPDDYRVEIDANVFKTQLLDQIEENFTLDYFESCLESSTKQIASKKAFLVDPKGQIEEIEASPEVESEIWQQATRLFNLSFRDQIGKILLKIQQQKESELQEQLGFEHQPRSSFNPFAIEQTIFDDIQKISKSVQDSNQYLSAVKEYIQEKDFILVMYDLHLMLLNFLQFVSNRTIFIFFEEIADESVSYPLFFAEINIRKGDTAFIIESARDILMINTPAINSFRFESVLTTPRACRLENASQNLQIIEQFLQAYYQSSQITLLQPNFEKLVAKDLPPIKYRVGLQLLDEDRKILDYSELITKLDTGAGRKFVDLVANYVEGNVENTTDQIHHDYKQSYPKKSVKNIIDDVPVKLNDSQKRILLAAKNPKNSIIKVEGPPGTGKSYTICALVYLANLLEKSVLITSHKKQALDVVEDMLNEQFESLHPSAKPAIMRFTTKSNLGETSNNILNTLSSSAINAASERVLNFNQEAIEKDRNMLYEEIETQNKNFWQAAENYYPNLKKASELLSLEIELFGQSMDLRKLPLGLSFTALYESRENFKAFSFRNPITWSQFITLYSLRDQLQSLTSKCDRLNKLQSQVIGESVDLDLSSGDLTDLQNLVNQLIIHCQLDVPLSSFSFVDLDLSLLEEQRFNYHVTYSDAIKVKSLLEDLIRAQKGLIKRIFGSSEKDEFETILKNDYPGVFRAVQDRGLDLVLDDFSQAIDLTKQYHTKYPFLSSDYILYGYQSTPIKKIQLQFEDLNSLKFDVILQKIEEQTERDRDALTLKSILDSIENLRLIDEYNHLVAEINEVKNVSQLNNSNLNTLYHYLNDTQSIIDSLDPEFISTTDRFLEYYTPALTCIGIDPVDLNSLAKLCLSEEPYLKFWDFIQLHEQVSHQPIARPPDPIKISQFEDKVYKSLEYQNDRGIKDFNNYSGDIQRAITAFNTNKRLTTDQAKMLFDSLSCVISTPNLISEYLPMENDMVDILIIDEASQVSIAESISLMLRAKQTIVFGDQLQYGAVSAQNVSKKYSMRYFKDILDAYEKDKNDIITESEKERLAAEVSEDVPEEERFSITLEPVDPNQKEWLKTFGIRTSTLSFAEAMANYKTSLDVHFRSFPEIISYSREKFYRENQINLIVNRIRTKPISQVLRFIKVESQGFAGKNINLDEIEAIKQDLQTILDDGFMGTIGIICSFREQASRMESIFKQSLPDYYRLVRDQAFEIWFVGDVQGVERDLIYYSFVEDKAQGNGSLKYIYPVVGGRADDIHNLQKQRLNVGFSRAKDTMVFVHSMPLGDYADTCLGEALNHYQHLAEITQDNYVSDTNIFGSPAEEKLYRLMIQTDFYLNHRENLRLIPQFKIGKYLNERYQRYIPNYRVDFLVTLSEGGKEKSLIVEYDGVEFHFENPETITRYNFDQEFIEYDIQRQLELEQYGYSFLRINKFNLAPQDQGQTEVDVLNDLLIQSFIRN